MPDNSDQLARLGQQVVDAFTEAYDPKGDASLAVGLHPGQPVPDNIMQDGQANPLVVSQWLGDQYDYPLLLRTGDESSIVTTIGTVTARSAYATMAGFAQPAVAPDDPAFARLVQLLASAKADIGEHPELLPLQAEPDDFTAVSSTAWQVFDHTVEAEVTTADTTPLPPKRVFINPQLWQMRAAPPEVLQAFAPAEAAPHIAVVETGGIAASPAPQHAMFAHALHLAPSTLISSTMKVGALSAMADVMEAPPAPAPAPVKAIQFNPALLHELTFVKAQDVVQQPGQTQATTTTSSLHAHFEFAIVAIGRSLSGRPWWRPDFLVETAWNVPGMKRGAMVPDPPDTDHGYYLPRSLLLVRNVQLTGVWSDQAQSTLNQPVHYVGPFLMTTPDATATSSTSATVAGATTIVGVGVQVIGEICTPLPTLPPRDSVPAASPPQDSVPAGSP